MYAFVDQSPACLASGSCFLLAAQRGWALAEARNQCPALSLAGWFSRMNLLPAVNDFSMVMRGLYDSERAQMMVREPAFPQITEFEAIMIALWADLARQRSMEAAAVLELMLTEQQCPRILASMQRTVMPMRAVGMPPIGLEAGRDFKTVADRKSH